MKRTDTRHAAEPTDDHTNTGHGSSGHFSSDSVSGADSAVLAHTSSANFLPTNLHRHDESDESSHHENRATERHVVQHDNSDRSAQGETSPRSSTSDGHDSGVDLTTADTCSKTVSPSDGQHMSSALPSISETGDLNIDPPNELSITHSSTSEVYGTPEYRALEYLEVEIDTWIEEDLPLLAQHVFGQVTMQADQSADDDAMSISSTRSRDSVRATLNRMRSKRVRANGDNKSASKAHQALQKTCGLCKLPYETNEALLRQHLSRHLTQLSATEAWPICSVCQIGFARKEDLDLHQRITASGDCCQLGRGHNGQCQGYACGFNFEHDAPCNGHHPPSEVHATGSNHDRFKFGQLLRRWEHAQLRSMITQIEDLGISQRAPDRTSKVSLPNMKLFQRFSITSMAPSDFSWHSQPQLQTSSMLDVEQRLATLNVGGTSANIRRGMTRLRGLQDQVDHELSRALEQDNVDSALKLIRRGARPSGALLTAVERRSRASIELLLHAGATVGSEHLINCVRAQETELVKLLLSHRNAAAIRQTVGAALLRVAVGLQQLSMVTALLESGVDPNRTPDLSCDDNVGYMLRELDNPGFMQAVEPEARLELAGELPFSRRPLFVAARSGDLETLQVLLEGGADIEGAEVEGTPLGAAITSGSVACLKAVLFPDRHVKYEACWYSYGAMEVATSQQDPAITRELISHCIRTGHRQCKHIDQALTIAVGEKNLQTLDVLAEFLPEICTWQDGRDRTIIDVVTDSWTHDMAEGYPWLIRRLAEGLPARTGDVTVLYRLAKSGHENLVKVMIDRVRLIYSIGASGEAESADCVTSGAISQTTLVLHHTVFAAMLSRDTNAVSYALHFTIRQQFDENITCILLDFLLKCGAAIDRLLYNETALRIAARHGLLKVVELLLSKGANPSCGALFEVTSLCVPASWQIFDTLVRYGASIDELYDCSTPRDLATAFNRHWSYICFMSTESEYLLAVLEHLPDINPAYLRRIFQATSVEHAAELFLRDGKISNPLDWAMCMGSSYLVAVLVLAEPQATLPGAGTFRHTSNSRSTLRQNNSTLTQPIHTARLNFRRLMVHLRKVGEHDREHTIRIHLAADTLLGAVRKSFPGADKTVLARQMSGHEQAWTPICSHLIRSYLRRSINAQDGQQDYPAYSDTLSHVEEFMMAQDLIVEICGLHLPLARAETSPQQRHYETLPLPPIQPLRNGAS